MPLDNSSVENHKVKMVTNVLTPVGRDTRDGMLIKGKPIKTNGHPELGIPPMLLGKNTGNPGTEQSRHFGRHLSECVRTPRAKGWIGPGDT